MAVGSKRLLYLLLATLCVAKSYAAETLYRYRNAENVVVIDFSIPPAFAAGGYEIITPQGRVIETVPPASDHASPDQHQLLLQQKREDKFIMRSYSTVQDVENAKDRRVKLLSRELDILKANLAEFQERRRTLRKQAASYQASGTAPPEAIEAILVDLREQERNTKALLAERHQQHQELIEKYDYYARRLVELKGVTALGERADAALGSKKPTNIPAVDDTATSNH